MSRPATSPLIPIAVACLGIALFSVMDGVMKALTLALGAYNAMLWRQMAGFAIGGSAFLATRSRWPSREVLKLHALRGGLGSVMALTFFWGIARVPLAEGIALSFIAPLITLYLAAVILKERIGARAVIASLMGIAGVGVILAGKLGAGHMTDDALWGVGAIFISALIYAYNLILQRQQAQLAGPLEVAFFVNLFGFAVMLTGAPFLAVVPSIDYLPAILLGAGLAFVSLQLLAWAYARAEAQVLVPVEYTAFIWAVIVGWYAFDEAVTLATFAGTILIVAGCIIAARQKAQAEHVEASQL